MLRLTDEQLREVQEIAAPLTAFQRGAFLARLAENLSECAPPYGSGAVHRAAVLARAVVLASQRRRA